MFVPQLNLFKNLLITHQNVKLVWSFFMVFSVYFHFLYKQVESIRSIKTGSVRTNLMWIYHNHRKQHLILKRIYYAKICFKRANAWRSPNRCYKRLTQRLFKMSGTCIVLSRKCFTKYSDGSSLFSSWDCRVCFLRTNQSSFILTFPQSKRNPKN